MNSVLLGLILSACVVFSATTDTSDYSCDEAGYLNYLSAWTATEKTTSRDSTSAEFKQRLEYFVDSCEKIHEWNLRNKYHMEFTFYADWHADEFDMLSVTEQRYSGLKPEIPSTTPVLNNSNWRHLLPLTNPCDDVFDGQENMLHEVIGRPQNCSVSWAFAITDSIEFAIKKLYLETYDQIVDVALSAQELIDCVAKDHGIQGNRCTAVPLVWGFDYVFENGIAYRQFYPHTNMEADTCNMVEDYQKYHIAGYEKPHVYNKLGLFEMLLKGPTAVALGLDPEYFQYYRSDAEEGPFFNTAYWRPSVYGVVVEYKQYAVDGESELAQWPFFAVETRLRACDSFIFRLPILESTGDGNIAGIAGFAIRPIVNEMISSGTEAPTTVAPTTAAPTTVAPTTVAPTTIAPTTVAPTTIAPTTVAPTTVAPTTAAPTTVAPTTIAPTTVAPTTEAPVVPTTETPVVPTTEAPVVPTTETPVIPTTEAPVVPTTETPVIPTTEAPVVPTTEAPVVPTTETPVIPTTEAPVIPTTEVPTTEAPVVPTTEAPVVPTTEAPTVAPTVDTTTAAPTVAPTPAPTREPVPTIEFPTTKPPTVAPTTVAPTTEAPIVPTTEAPIVPTTEAPIVPTTEAPIVPTTEAPIVPTTEAPIVPTTEAPIVPTTEAPIVPTTEAPIVPTTEAPIVPTTEAPIVPTSEPTVKPTSFIPPTTEAPMVPTTEGPAVPTTELPTTIPGPVTVYASETEFATLEEIRNDVEILVFIIDSYPDMIEVNLSGFTNLTTLVFESGSFKNAQSVIIESSTVTHIAFRPNTFCGDSVDGSLTLHTPMLQEVIFDANSLHFMHSVHLRGLGAPIQYYVYNGALANVDTIYYMNTYSGYAKAMADAIYASGHPELINIIEESVTPSP